MAEQKPASKRRERWFEIRRPIHGGRAWALGVTVWVIFFAVWQLAVVTGLVTELLVPTPGKVLASLHELFFERDLARDVGISMLRIVGSFSAACAIAIPLGLLMGSFRTVEAFVNPFVSAWRYLPAPSFVPVLLMWFGTGEGPKLALLFIGVVFLLITLIMDYTKQVPIELIETAMTLGAKRHQILRTVTIPAALPNIVIAMRQMLAVSWTYLVIAEIVASTTGIGAMMMRARRFLHTDEIMGGIVVIGVLGLLFDLLFRLLHRVLFPYLDPGSH